MSIVIYALALLCFHIYFIYLNAYKVVKDESDVIYLIYPKRSVAARIPDEKTLAELKLDFVPVTKVSRIYLSAFRIENKTLPSLNLRVKTRDDLMQYEILKILSLSPPIFWKDTYYLGRMLNPALENWQGRTFLTWRNGMYDSPINFAWFDLEEVLRRKHKVDTKLLQKPNDKQYPYIQSIIPMTIKEFTFNHLQEDPRLLVRQDGSLAIIYTVKESLFKPPKQAYCHVSSMSSSTSLYPSLPAEIVDTVLLDGHSFDPSQKNWIALEHQQSLYFIQSVNPLVVLQHRGANGSDPRIGKMETIHHSTTTIPLPWKDDYGSFIRGGTPAILVAPQHPAHVLPKYYLSFFHSVAQLQDKNPLRTYFMGAVSFCPKPPFHIHAISTHPIVQEKFYDGAWVEPRRTDYVMFAIGIMQREHDIEHVYVTFGHQDHDGYLAKFHLGELFASMEIVQDCK